MSKKEAWEIEYDKKQKDLAVGISKLSNEQIESIDKTIKHLFSISFNTKKGINVNK